MGLILELVSSGAEQPPAMTRKVIGAEGGTIGEVLNAMVESHPDTQRQIFADGGELNRYVNVYLNDEDVRVLGGLETPVKPQDTVVILPAMAGG